MNTQEIYQYLLGVVDDSDQTFMTPAIAATWLAIGEREFRRFITNIDASIYVTNYTATANGTSLSLDGTLLGGTATQPRLESIVRIVTLSGAVPTGILNQVTSYEALYGRVLRGNTKYCLQNRTLYFSTALNSSIQIQYIPAPSTAWLAGLTLTTYVDDIADQFGDMIALYAMQQYKMKDFFENPYQANQLARREAALRSYLTRGRNSEASRYVTEEGDEY